MLMAMTTDFIPHYQQRTEQILARILPGDEASPTQLHKAMRYACLDGGKRIRPLLVYAVGALFDVMPEQLDSAASAVELIHCYSLVHDDLPAMDNDELRRGKPTCHIQFGDAIAMLAGDALQAEAFAMLAADHSLSSEQRVKLLTLLGKACGSRGMAGGQAIDLCSVGKKLSVEQLSTMHRLKTGALIESSILMGAVVANADAETYRALSEFAEAIGLAFQIQDDVLDVIGDTGILGKRQGADAELNKPTYPSLLGLTAAKELVAEHYQEGMTSLAIFDEKADALREVADYIVRRDY